MGELKAQRGVDQGELRAHRGSLSAREDQTKPVEMRPPAEFFAQIHHAPHTLVMQLHGEFCSTYA